MALEVSAYSLRSLADLAVPLMPNGGSIVGLTFDATLAWPAYNWMGVAKAAMESLNRYLAKELGPKQIRSNLIAAGPMRTIAAKSIPGFAQFEDEWTKRAPLGWDVRDNTGVSRACVALTQRPLHPHHRPDHSRRRWVQHRRSVARVIDFSPWSWLSWRRSRRRRPMGTGLLRSCRRGGSRGERVGYRWRCHRRRCIR